MDIKRALLYKWPGAEWSLNGGVYEGLVWNDHNHPKPTKAQLEEAFAEYLEKESYKEKRRDEYQRVAPLHEMVFALWDKVMEGSDNNADELQAKRLAVKKAHPKGDK